MFGAGVPWATALAALLTMAACALSPADGPAALHRAPSEPIAGQPMPALRAAPQTAPAPAGGESPPAVALRGPWQPASEPLRPFPRRVERWRDLVRQVLGEEWEAGQLDGPASRLDDDLILAMIQQESGGNSRALSRAGAIGLLQVMPGTFALEMAGDESLAPAIDPAAFWDEASNVRAGVRYLALAMQYQDGNLYWSVASYNAGIGVVRRWRLAGLYAVPPIGGYAETAAYAQAILRNYTRHRPDVDLFIPDPMPPEHVAGALQLLREQRRRATS